MNAHSIIIFLISIINFVLKKLKLNNIIIENLLEIKVEHYK